MIFHMVSIVFVINDVSTMQAPQLPELAPSSMTYMMYTVLPNAKLLILVMINALRVTVLTSYSDGYKARG